MHTALAIWTLAVLPLAAALYRLRRRNRVWYGGFELTIAVGFFYFLLVGIDSGWPKPMSLELILNRMLTFFAAIYFMVRALDNIGEGLAASKFKQRRDTLFAVEDQNGEGRLVGAVEIEPTTSPV